MSKTKELLNKLNIRRCSNRHLRIIDEFIKSKEKDCKALLDVFGIWDDNDLKIVQEWAESLKN